VLDRITRIGISVATLARCWRSIAKLRASIAVPATRGASVLASSLIFLLVGPTAARAHGLPPSTLGVVAADDEGQPNMVILNEGLAFGRGDRWSFICPRLWGDPDTSSGKNPLAWSLDGVETWIIGADDLYSARDGVLTPQQRSDASSRSIAALAADDDALFGLKVAADGSAVVRIDQADAAPLFTSNEIWSWLAIGQGRVHLARVTAASELARVTLDRTGQPIEEVVHTDAGAIAQLHLRPTARGLYAVVYDGTQYSLALLEQQTWQDVLHSPGPIAGPAASGDGTLWIAADGVLMRDAGAGFQAVGETRSVTCLRQYRSLAYACVGTDLHRLGNAGLGARLFQLAGLRERDPALIPATAARDCHFQWLLFRNDLERTGLAPRDFVDSAAEDAGSDDASAEPSSDAASPSPAERGDGGAAPLPSASGSGCACSAARAGRGRDGLKVLTGAALACWWLARARTRALRARRPLS
jgi:hypothetical protein